MRGFEACGLWNQTVPEDEDLPAHFAAQENIRVGGILEFQMDEYVPCTEAGCEYETFETHVLFNDNFTVSYT